MTAIAMGDFLPGDRLPPERELVVTFGIGRAAIHDALGRLEAMGLVDDHLEGCHVRDAIEGAAVSGS